MTQSGATTDRRAQTIAAMGFLLQLASFGAMLVLGIWSKSDAVLSLARWLVAGLPIWAVLYLIFKQLGRVAAEELEAAELRRARQAGAAESIFEIEEEALYLERNRLRWMIKWMLPATTVLVAAVLLIGQFLFWPWTLAGAFEAGHVRRAQNPTLAMWCVVALGFGSFLVAKYCLTLSRNPSWRLLHAGGAYMAGNALLCLAVAVALGASSNIAWAEPLIAYIIRVGMIVLGVELGVNFILDFYRPRTPGFVPRPSFDSRVLGLIADPGGIAKSIADTINYQFGFEVSSTWFYKLLQQWLLPILACSLLVVIALTSLVIVDAGEAAVIERFGRPLKNPSTVLGPGLHWKLPYPIDMARKAPARHLRESVLGEISKEDKDHAPKAIVWTEEHEYAPELMLLVGSPQAGESVTRPLSEAVDKPSTYGTQSVAVSLLMVSVPIEYRVSDPEKFLYNYADPVGVMESVAYQYLSDFASSTDIDQLMGPGRAEFNRQFKQVLQQRLNALDPPPGIEVVAAGIRDAHPPAKDQVAQTFLSVVNAQTQRAATIAAAEGEALKILISVAGAEGRARALNEAIRARDRLRNQDHAPAEDIAEADRKVDDLLMGNPERGIAPPSGKVAVELAAARAQAASAIASATAKAHAFAADVAAFNVAPDLYRQRKVLEMYADLTRIRKYLIVGDPANVIVEYETSEQGGLDRVLSESASQGQK